MKTLVAALAVAAAVAVPSPASAAEPAWAPAATAAVHPGVQTSTGGQQCTANFVFYDSAGTVYLGQSAHCASRSGPTVTNGCQAQTFPIGQQVTVGGATRPGTMVYNSWVAMKDAGENAATDVCRYNDFSLVRLDPADWARVNPSVPFWGGPGALAQGAASFTEVYTYGNSSLRLGFTPVSPKQGYTVNNNPSGGWTHTVYTVSPGIPGDSGSAFLDASGNALGTLSTVSATGSNGVGNLANELAYARSHGFASLELALGTVAFAPLV
ncbi:MAG TPA: serine protease [Frankiaceae bacterium]|jgi:hypothetical protein|nr:serine protease [Frankiaceae bacterium]